ncbi:MAG: dipeptidase [Planctomycetes bacterium]|nr:dipeptidase [Planctomycetota bacterium]
MFDKSALKLHHSSFIVDGHADTFWRIAMRANPPARKGTAKYKYFRSTPDFFTGIPPTKPGEMAKSHVDFQRLKMGGTNLQFMAVYSPPKYTGLAATTFALKMVFEVLHGVRQSSSMSFLPRPQCHSREGGNPVWRDKLQRESKILDTCFRRYDNKRNRNDELVIVKSAADLTDLVRRDGMGFLINIEGGNPLNKDVGILKVFYELGVRSLGLTHNPHNDLGDGIGIKRPRGLTSFGKTVVRELNRLGMLIDVAHLARPGFRDVARIAKGPFISSHTGVRALRDIPRNLDDEQIKEICRRQGVMGVFYLPDYLKAFKRKKDSATIKDVVNHIQYIADKFGVDYVGLGSDWDGYGGVTYGLEDCSCLPNITQELVRRGFNRNEIRKILGGNFVRVIKQILK